MMISLLASGHETELFRPCFPNCLIPIESQIEFLKLINQYLIFQTGIFTDLTSTLLKGDLHETSNTSREVQDILGEFSVGPSGAPALPPKQNANSSSTNANASNTSSSSLNRPSSVQVNFVKNLVLKKYPPKN